MKEHQRMEWKESWRNECLKWICAFANAEGGVLVILGLMVTFRANPAHIQAAGKFFPETVTTRETTRETTQDKILAILRSAPATTRRELAAKIGITADGIKYHLKKLSADGVIRHVGPKKTGRWEVLK